MRFPTRLLAANVWFAGACWLGFVLFVAAVIAVAAGVTGITQSGWEVASQVPLWFALFAGVALVREFLPLYVAHGQTRRRFAADAAGTVLLFAPFLSALVVVGYLLEAAAYRLLGWPQELSQEHLYAAPTDVPLVFAEHTVGLVAALVAGTFLGAAFYRWGAAGLLAVPVGAALVVVAHASIGGGLQLPLITSGIALDRPASLGVALGVALGVGLGAFAVGSALTWAVVRDIPVRNRPA